jgi:hypothetical protein
MGAFADLYSFEFLTFLGRTLQPRLDLNLYVLVRTNTCIWNQNENGACDRKLEWECFGCNKKLENSAVDSHLRMSDG